MTEHWEGAQWLMCYYLVGTSISPWFFRLSGIFIKTEKPFAEWFGEYLARVMEHAILATVLWWGGFWS